MGHVGVHNNDEITGGELNAVNVGCTESKLAGSRLQELYHSNSKVWRWLVAENRGA